MMMMMMMMMMSTDDIDEECDMEGDRHLYEESFREQQKILLNLVRRGQDVFAILPTGSGRP